MENFTFKYENGKYILKESYGALAEADPGDINPSADASYKTPGFATAKEPEIKTPGFLSGESEPEVKTDNKANSAYISGFLSNLGFSKPEIEKIYEKVKIWGRTLAGPGTLIVFDDTALKRELDKSSEESTTKDSENDDSNKKDPTVMKEIEGLIDSINSELSKRKNINDKVKYLESVLKSARNHYATIENPTDKNRKVVKGIEEYIKVTIEQIQNAGIPSTTPSSTAPKAPAPPRTPATSAEISESYAKIRMPKNNKKHPSLVGWRAR